MPAALCRQAWPRPSAATSLGSPGPVCPLNPGTSGLPGRKASEWPGPTGLAPGSLFSVGAESEGHRGRGAGVGGQGRWQLLILWPGGLQGSCAGPPRNRCLERRWTEAAGVSGLQVLGCPQPHPAVRGAGRLAGGSQSPRRGPPGGEQECPSWGANPSEASAPAARLPGAWAGAVRPDAQARPRAQLAPPGPFPLLPPTSRGGD